MVNICKKCKLKMAFDVEYARYPGPLVEKVIVCHACGFKEFLR